MFNERKNSREKLGIDRVMRVTAGPAERERRVEREAKTRTGIV